MNHPLSTLDLESVCRRLNQRGFQASAYDSGAQAARALLEQIKPHSTVGIGGSVTIQALGISRKLRDKGCTVFWHWEAEDDSAAREAAFQADYYLLSANALGEDGVVYNIDGTGNRVAATLFGPAKVIMIIGRNKLVPGGYEDALQRIRQTACPQNARRLKLQTPCAVTGACTDCKSPQRMCAAVVALQKRPSGKPSFHVLLADEDLGY